MTESVEKEAAHDEPPHCAEYQAAVRYLLGISLEEMPLEEMLSRALDRILSISWLKPEPKGGIWLIDEAAGELRLKAQRGFSAEQQNACGAVPSGTCVCGKAASTGKPVYVGDCFNEAHEIIYRGIARHGHYSVPILYGGRVLGVITLYFKQGRARNDNEIAFLISIAEILAGVIEREKNGQYIRHRLAFEKALGSLSRIFILQSDGYINAALEILGQAVAATRAYIFDICSDCAGFDAAYEWRAGGWESRKEGFGKVEKTRLPLWFETLEKGEPVVVEDSGALGPESASEKELLLSLGIASFLAVPIMTREGKLHGFAGFDNAGQRRKWMDDDNYLIRLACDIFSYDYERRAKDKTINHMAYHDYLTGLPNRRLLADRITQTFARGGWKGRLAALLLLDINRFKNINDLFGHDAGDGLLRAVAERLSGSVREGDTVAYAGGDEFMVFLQEIARAEDVIRVAEKIFSALRPPVFVNGEDISATVSMGISIYPEDGDNAEALIRSADAAMCQAKKDGINCWRIYSPAMNEKALEFFAMEKRLRNALANGEFFLLYQPQVDMRNGRVTGSEALVRWRDPLTGSVIPPGEFIPVAEKTGIIVDLGVWVLKNACMQNRRLGDRGHKLTVSVNVSSRQFKQKDFTATIDAILAQTGLDPHQLEIELTESVIMENMDEALGVMRELRAKGMRFAIDDFGTGFSSLSYLKRMPIDTLKIDKSFVNNITENADDASIAIAVIRLAHNMNLKVVAEGVETEAQRLFLRRLECDRMQGYLFAKPLSAYEFEKLIAEGKTMDVK
ncbi:MAG: EAL domain-containing protein [Deltaproteobacteria bacterium]|nr:EAL domain-containing protein [Deltaproteobacteria bacterium]